MSTHFFYTNQDVWSPDRWGLHFVHIDECAVAVMQSVLLTKVCRELELVLELELELVLELEFELELELKQVWYLFYICLIVF